MFSNRCMLFTPLFLTNESAALVKSWLCKVFGVYEVHLKISLWYWHCQWLYDLKKGFFLLIAIGWLCKY